MQFDCLDEYRKIKDLEKLEELRREEEEYHREKRRQQRHKQHHDELKEYLAKKRQTEELLMMDTVRIKGKKQSKSMYSSLNNH